MLRLIIIIFFLELQFELKPSTNCYFMDLCVLCTMDDLIYEWK